MTLLFLLVAGLGSDLRDERTYTLAFTDGKTLYFSRWDPSQHTLVNDRPAGFEMSDEEKGVDHC